MVVVEVEALFAATENIKHNKELDYLSGIMSWMVKRKYAIRLLQ